MSGTKKKTVETKWGDKKLTVNTDGSGMKYEYPGYSEEKKVGWLGRMLGCKLVEDRVNEIYSKNSS